MRRSVKCKGMLNSAYQYITDIWQLEASTHPCYKTSEFTQAYCVGCCKIYSLQASYVINVNDILVYLSPWKRFRSMVPELEAEMQTTTAISF